MPAVAEQEGGELQYVRARQVLVPDFYLRLPTTQGPTDCLAELKVIGAGVTWHPRVWKGKWVDKRAATLQGYYRRELAKYDTRFHGTTGRETGPLVTLLESFGKLEGLVIGPWATAPMTCTAWCGPWRSAGWRPGRAQSIIPSMCLQPGCIGPKVPAKF